MRRVFVMAMVVGLLGSGAYVPAASGSSVSLQLTSPSTTIVLGDSATFDIVMSIDGTGGGDGNISSTTTSLVTSNSNALITAGVSAPASSGVGLTNFNLRDAGFVAVGACVNTATTGTCTYAPGAPAAGNYGGITTGIATPGTWTVGSVTVTGMAVGNTTLQLIVRPGLEWADGFANALPTQPTLGSALVTVVPIPEPATAALIGLGLVGLVVAGRRSRA